MKRSRRTGCAVIAGLALLAAGGCGSDGTASGDGLEVLTSFYPLQYVAERIAGDAAAVTNLVPPGSEPHSFELSGRDVATVADADLVVYLKDFQPAVDDAVASEASETAFDVSPHARLLSSDELAAEEHGAGEHEEGHEEEGHEEEGHDHGGDDPHFWLDPTRLADVADQLSERLADLDPDHADAYAANAEQLRADLTELDEEFAAGLEGCENPDIVTSHTAFGYLAERYGLTQVGISGLSTESEPNTRELARIAEFVRDHNVNTIYYETLVAPDVAEVVANEVGARTAVLDPIEGLTDASPGENYLEIMRANLDSLMENQPCGS